MVPAPAPIDSYLTPPLHETFGSTERGTTGQGRIGVNMSIYRTVVGYKSRNILHVYIELKIVIYCKSGYLRWLYMFSIIKQYVSVLNTCIQDFFYHSKVLIFFTISVGAFSTILSLQRN